jgi:cytochrome c peroxidase
LVTWSIELAFSSILPHFDTSIQRARDSKGGKLEMIFDIMQKWSVIGLAVALMLSGSLTSTAQAEEVHKWSNKEIEILRSLWLYSLPPVPKNASNAFADDPRAAELGKKFFFDTRFSGNSKVSCGTCHRKDYVFTDNLPVAHGMGFTARRTMPLAGMAYMPWLFWDGRKDSLWSQALGPLESTVEHGISRTFCARIILEFYQSEYEGVFGPVKEMKAFRRMNARPGLDDPEAYKAWVNIPFDQRAEVNRIYANMGKAIAAYVRTIMPGPARFDRYVEASLKNDRSRMEQIFTDKEAGGLRLFIGKAKCTNCHTGPLFTNGDFHNIHVGEKEGRPADRGRADGIIQALSDEFNCLGEFSDAEPRDCAELRFIDTETEKYAGAFKTPTLRNVAERPPYMHAGQLKSIREVLEFYRSADNPELGHGDLTDHELEQLEAFLGTLSGPIVSLGEPM